MLHKIVIALMIWGLIAQPLTAAMPDRMAAESSSSFETVDTDSVNASHHAMIGNDTSAPPCHETAEEAPVALDCADCTDDCANGVCASSCSVVSPTVVSEAVPQLLRPTSVRVFGSTGALVQGLLSRIFHPPKNA